MFIVPFLFESNSLTIPLFYEAHCIEMFCNIKSHDINMKTVYFKCLDRRKAVDSGWWRKN